MEADVVFVHGLLGGAFKTWRQKDTEAKTSKGPIKEEEEEVEVHNDEATECWPKVRLGGVNTLRVVQLPKHLCQNVVLKRDCVVIIKAGLLLCME